METIKTLVTEVRNKAQGIKIYELRSLDGSNLPAFSAGAHIDVNVPNGFVRSYSLCNSPSESHRYLIAVNLDQASRGGSICMHASVRSGDVLTISPPINNFELAEDAKMSFLIAGGIGITPLWSMVQRLQDIRKPWRLYYCAREPRAAAFVDELQQYAMPERERLHLHFDSEQAGKLLDLAEIVKHARADTHLYCCGPAGLIEAFECATRSLPRSLLHVEHFSNSQRPAIAGGFVVELAKSKKQLTIPAGSSILDALLAAGVDAPYSCQEGLCATCETRVIAGIPDHRDHVLSEREKASNCTIMICCSGSKSDRLILDL